MNRKSLSVAIIFFAATLLAGCGGMPTGFGGDVQSGLMPQQSFMDQEQVPPVDTNANSVDEGIVLASTSNRETTPRMQNPNNAMTLVLSGEMGNGGLWSWTDIGNLLGVYSTYGSFSNVEVNGQSYSGVPLSYLLHYVELNSYARYIQVTDRANNLYSFSLDSLRNCTECLVAENSAGSLSLILPQHNPFLIDNVMSIEAYETRTENTVEMLILDDSQSLMLGGQFARAGEWTWEDISNLMGVYEQYGVYMSVVAGGQEYQGVPLRYLLDYATLGSSVNGLVFYDRSGEMTSAAVSSLVDCTNCIISLQADNTLSLVMPGREPAVLAQLAGIEAR